jgi:hypothetical protein
MSDGQVSDSGPLLNLCLSAVIITAVIITALQLVYLASASELVRHFLFSMVYNKEKLYHNFFSTLLQNMPLGRPIKIKRDWNWMGHFTGRIGF